MILICPGGPSTRDAGSRAVTANTYSSRHGAVEGVIRGMLERIYRVWNDSLISENEGEPYLQHKGQSLSPFSEGEGNDVSQERWKGRTIVFSGQQAPF